MFSSVVKDAMLKQRAKVEVKCRREGWKREYCSGKDPTETLELGDEKNRLCCWIVGNVCV